MTIESTEASGSVRRTSRHVPSRIEFNTRPDYTEIGKSLKLFCNRALILGL